MPTTLWTFVSSKYIKYKVFGVDTSKVDPQAKVLIAKLGDLGSTPGENQIPQVLL